MSVVFWVVMGEDAVPCYFPGFVPGDPRPYGLEGRGSLARCAAPRQIHCAVEDKLLYRFRVVE